MSALQYYYNTIVKQDLLTKFQYTNLFQIPKIRKISMNFHVTSSSLKQLLPLISGLTLASGKKPYLLTSNRVNLVLKLKKGFPIGCMVTLRGEEKFLFLERLIFLIFPKLKDSLQHTIKIGERSVFLKLENLFVFKEVEKEYENFQELPNLDISIEISSKNKKEISSLLSALKIPVKKN